MKQKIAYYLLSKQWFKSIVRKSYFSEIKKEIKKDLVKEIKEEILYEPINKIDKLIKYYEKLYNPHLHDYSMEIVCKEKISSLKTALSYFENKEKIINPSRKSK